MVFRLFGASRKTILIRLQRGCDAPVTWPCYPAFRTRTSSEILMQTRTGMLPATKQQEE